MQRQKQSTDIWDEETCWVMTEPFFGHVVGLGLALLGHGLALLGHGLALLDHGLALLGHGLVLLGPWRNSVLSLPSSVKVMA